MDEQIKKDNLITNTNKPIHKPYTQVVRKENSFAPRPMSPNSTSPASAMGQRKPSKTYQYRSHGKKPTSGNFRNETRLPSRTKTIPDPEEGVIRIIPMMGVEEIGGNMTIFETKDDILIIDAGMKFKGESTPGIDYMIPNTTYLEERKDKIRGIIITHGHLDHIGGISLVASRVGNPPIYSRYLSTLLMQKRHAEFPHLKELDIKVVEKGDILTIGKTRVRIFGVTHTIPDSMGIAIETPYGYVVNAGDYKLDQIDGIATDEEEKEYAFFDKEKTLLLITDSTNIENEGFSLPEYKVHEGLEKIITRIQGRMIISAFSSSITRLIKIIQIAEALGKKVAIEGRSMKTNMEVVVTAGLFIPKKDTIIPLEDVEKYPPHKVIVLMTGAQGEIFSALSRASTKTHRKFTFQKGDTIILSSSIVPGNEIAVQRIKDGLSRQGVNIISFRTAGEEYVHATGHGNQEDIKWLHRKVHEKFFIPIHGHHSMLQSHRRLAIGLGMPEDSVIVPDNGNIIEIIDNGSKMIVRKEKAPASPMIVDGNAISDNQEVVMRDRQMLSEDGMFVVVVAVNQKEKTLRKSADIISRGFIYLKENQDLLQQVRLIVKKAVTDAVKIDDQESIEKLKGKLGENISKFLYQQTAKRPLVIPVIISI